MSAPMKLRLTISIALFFISFLTLASFGAGVATAIRHTGRTR
jgi:hypothetical protein